MTRNPHRHAAPAAAILALCCALPAFQGIPPATAMAIGAGADYAQGPGDRTTRTAAGALTFSGGPGALTLSGMRYDDSWLGTGYGLTGGLAVGALSSLASLRGSVTRYQGQGGFGAWRFRAGPELRLPSGQRLRADATRFTSSLDETATGLLLEATSPVFPGFTGRATYSTFKWNDGLHSQELSAGVDCSLVSHLLIVAELGAIRNRDAPASSASGGQSNVLPPLFGFGAPDPGSNSPENGVFGTARMSVRMSFP